MYDLANFIAPNLLNDQLTVMKLIVIGVVSLGPQLLVQMTEEATDVLPLVVQECQVLPVQVEVVFNLSTIPIEFLLILEADVFLEVVIEHLMLLCRYHSHINEPLLIVEEQRGVGEAALGDGGEEGLQGLHFEVPLEVGS